MSDREFWRDRPVLVTGHTGFKGSWLSLWLHRLGAEVTGYALEPPTEPALFEEAGLAGCVTDVRADVRDPEALAGTLRDAAPEVVLHLAACSLVRGSYDDPVTTWQTNVMGTVHLLEACRRAPSVRAVVVVTTDKVYEPEARGGTSPDGAPFSENDRLGGHDPYAASKSAAELAVGSWRRSFMDGTGSPAVASARAGNVVGGGDWATDRLVPDLLSGFAAGEPVGIRSPSAVRPWQHVLEPLSGYLLLARRLHAEAAAPPDRRPTARPWNFGPVRKDARAVADVADRLASLWGEGAAWRRDGGEHPHEAATLRLDWSRARDELGWRPRWGLDEALRRTVRWHRGWLEADGAGAVRAAMEEDLDAYGPVEVAP